MIFFILGINKNKGHEPDMFCFDIAYLQNALEHEKGQKGPAEICKFSGKKRLKGGARNADTEI